ncbi:hypothetical protein G9F72_011110 [Clostridium estertheticum]|uniref:hypothetical protein n=1 Tax=Clostridium estertheticum TaxID=238834 RepID=UPI0013E953C0|nr:hypothetical protein [Clostridium estertheticum]MBZ9686874.1 hypothetical protein [Clostridium estertheticum]
MQTAIATIGTNVTALLTNVGLVKTETALIKTDTTALLAKPNWNNATLNKVAQFYPSLPVNAFQSILNISGKGYVNKVLMDAGGTGAVMHIRITVDGVVMVLIQSPSDDSINAFGVLLEDLIKPSNSGSPSIIMAYFRNKYCNLYPNPDSYPHTLNYARTIVLAQPIYFNTSLLIELSCTDSGGKYIEVSYVVL